MAKIEWNDKGLAEAIEQARQRLEGQMNEELQGIVRQVRDEMSGQPAGAVYGELVRRIDEELPTFQVNEPRLLEVAVAIQDGTLTG